MDFSDGSETFAVKAKRVRLDEVRFDGHVCSISDLPASSSSSCSSTGRLAKLSALVKGCSHAELVHLSSTIEPLLKRDFLLSLPLEISVYILSFLSLRDILRCAQVSSRWERVASDSLLWYRLCLRDGIIDSVKQSVQQVDSGQPTAQENWKAVYRRSLETRCNWLHGSRCPPVVLGAHHNHVITCLEVFNDWAITGSDDSSICVWNLTHGQLLINLFGHIGGVWSLTVLPPCPGPKSPPLPPLLVSGSCDRTARVWSLDGSRWPCLTTLFGHQSTVRCLAGQGGDHLASEAVQSGCAVSGSADCHGTATTTTPLVVTGSRDTTLRLWDALSGRCLRVFQGHRGAVRCVQFWGSLVVSGSYDCTVRVWCARTGECLRTLSAHTNRVYTLLFDGVRIISASLDTTICVWDAQTGCLKHTFCGHRSLTSEMAYGRAPQQILVSSNADETIRVWDVETGECLHVLAGRHKHQSAVTCVQLTRHFIVSSGDDGTVKLWDRCTGSHIRDLVRLDGAGRGGVIWRIVSSESRLVCAAGSRNGLETTKLIVLNFADSSDGVEGAAESTNRLPHLCRSKSAPAPPPTLSQLLAASAFETDTSWDSAIS